jgi:hypothetical protein
VEALIRHEEAGRLWMHIDDLDYRMPPRRRGARLPDPLAMILQSAEEL